MTEPRVQKIPCMHGGTCVATSPSKKPNVPFLRGNGRSAILDRACTSRSLVVAHARFVVDTPVLHGFVCNDIEFLGVFIFE